MNRTIKAAIVLTGVFLGSAVVSKSAEHLDYDLNTTVQYSQDVQDVSKVVYAGLGAAAGAALTLALLGASKKEEEDAITPSCF